MMAYCHFLGHEPYVLENSKVCWCIVFLLTKYSCSMSQADVDEDEVAAKKEEILTQWVED
jgi:hypothetical protein